MASFHPAHLLSRGARSQNSHFLRKEGSRCSSSVPLGLWYPGSVVMGLALLRRERGCGERVCTAEILAELTERAAGCSVNPERFGSPAGLPDCREAVSLLYRLSHCYSWLSKDLTSVNSSPLFSFQKFEGASSSPKFHVFGGGTDSCPFFPYVIYLRSLK